MAMSAEDIMGAGEQTSEQPEQSTPTRRTAVISPPEGYRAVETWIVYQHESADAAEFASPDYVKALEGLVERKFPGQIVVGTQESLSRGSREHIATYVYIDTPESAEARKPKARGGKPKDTAKVLGKVLSKMNALQLDQEFLQEARVLGAEPKTLARERACAEFGISVDELRDALAAYIG